MKFFRLRKSNALYLLVLLGFIQSCVVYQTTPSSLSNAVNMGQVKLVAQSGVVYKFDSIKLTDGTYYGLGSAYSNLEHSITSDGVMTAIDSTKIAEVYIKDRKMSKNRSIALAIGIPVTLGAAFLGLLIIFWTLY